VVRLYLLGEMRLEAHGHHVELPSSHKARLLLAIVALERRVHGRSELAGRLWPDVREDSARASLRTALSRLRTALGAHAVAVLDVRHDGVALAAGAWTDVAHVETLLAGDRPEAALELCAQPLLAGFDDDEAHDARDRLQRRLLDGLAAAAARADDERALRLTIRWAALEPLAEVPQRELIRRHAMAGDRGAALAAYERFRTRLANELRIAPSAATRALVDEVRGDDRRAPAAQRSGIRYARSGALSIAYQSFGSGDRDLVIVPGWASNLDAIWDFPPLGPILAALGECARCLVFDKRGTGLSERTLGFGSLEERAEDVRAVMDAERVGRATVFAYSESAALALVFAAAHPGRVEQLVLYSSYARLVAGPDNPAGVPLQLVDAFIERIGSDWGTGTISPVSFGGAPTTNAARQLLARWERSLCTPTMAAHIIRRNADIDIRPLLTSIDSPALVMHSTGDPLCPPALGRYIADHLPQGRYLEREADYHLPWRGEDAWFLEPTRQLLTARQPASDVRTGVVATVLAIQPHGADGEFERAIGDGLRRFDGESVTTTTGERMAIFARPSCAVACAVAAAERLGVRASAGLHTGEIELRDGTVHGFAVELARCVAALAAPGEVLLSRTVRDLTMGSTLRFFDHGRHPLGDHGEWELFTPDR
jgi:DNA-binding SARP family transcriptional activator/pimeloyl-ACP methyl ester carboxylesterase